MTALLPANHAEAVRNAIDFVSLQTVLFGAARAVAAADGATFVVRDQDFCFYAAEDAIAPLWAGQRFPIADCISGWSMLTASQAVVDDVLDDSRIPQAAYRPTFVRSLIMTPVGLGEPVGALGVYWSQVRTDPPAGLILDALTELAREAGHAVDRLGLDTAPWAPNFTLRSRTA